MKKAISKSIYLLAITLISTGALAQGGADLRDIQQGERQLAQLRLEAALSSTSFSTEEVQYKTIEAGKEYRLTGKIYDHRSTKKTLCTFDQTLKVNGGAGEAIQCGDNHIAKLYISTQQGKIYLFRSLFDGHSTLVSQSKTLIPTSNTSTPRNTTTDAESIRQRYKQPGEY